MGELKKEKGPKIQIPKVELNLVFSQHFTKEGLKQVKKKIKDSHVVIFEYVGWDKNLLDLYNDVSKGKIKKSDLSKYIENENPFHKKYLLERLKVIHNSKKPIFFADIKSNSKESNEFSKLRKETIKSYFHSKKEFTKGNFVKSIRWCKKFIELEAKNNTSRENIIKNGISKIAEQFKKHKKFVDKKTIKITGHFGRNHFNIIDEMGDNEGVSYGIGVNESYSEAVRKKMNRKALNKMDYLKAIFEGILIDNIIHNKDNPLGKENPDKVVLMIKKIVEKFSYKDFKKICDLKIGNKGGGKRLSKFFKGKGLPERIPKNREELNQILGI